MTTHPIEKTPEREPIFILGRFEKEGENLQWIALARVDGMGGLSPWLLTESKSKVTTIDQAVELLRHIPPSKVLILCPSSDYSGETIKYLPFTLSELNKICGAFIHEEPPTIKFYCVW